jgi:hypothetical protein
MNEMPCDTDNSFSLKACKNVIKSTILPFA